MGKFVGILALVILVAALVLEQATLASPLEQSPREITVLAGAGQDTVQAFAYFPGVVQIRAGDTVTWKINSDGQHTVSFVDGWKPEGQTRDNSYGVPGSVITAPNIPVPDEEPGVVMRHPLEIFPTRAPGAAVEHYTGAEFVNSGRLRREAYVPGVLGLQTFSLVFDTPGIYTYLCLLHPDGMAGRIDVLPANAPNVPDQPAIDAEAQSEIATILQLSQRAHDAGSTARSM